MNRKLLLCGILLYNAAVAQQPLSQSQRTSIYTYVYQITAPEALRLYHDGLDKTGEAYLHTRIDSFPVPGKEPKLRPGNYLLVQARNNELHYELRSVGDLQLKVVNNNKDLVVVLHRNSGELVVTASVSMGRRRLPYDAATRSYRLNHYKKARDVQVLLEGTAYNFTIERSKGKGIYVRQLVRKTINTFPLKYITRQVRKWQGRDYTYTPYFTHSTPYEKRFRSFLMFSKPKYKPGDTVKLKAFVCHKKGRAVDRKLLLRLSDRAFDVDTVLAVLKPYRAGGYTYQFVLNDSLDLDLDDRYLVTLEEERSRRYDLDDYGGDLDDDQYAARRKVVARGTFEYEEYELGTITFSARADKTEHYRGEPLSLFFKASDENDLPVMDGRLEVLLLNSSNSREDFHAPVVFLPDTLWRHSQPLENIGETKVVMPDSVFPRASFNYQLACVLLNSNNERRTHTLFGKFYDDSAQLSFTQRRDSLYADLKVKGASTPAPAVVYAFHNDLDSVKVGDVQLPATIRLHPYVEFYRVVAGTVSRDYSPAKEKAGVSALASRTPDSLFVQLVNPLQLPVWYTVFAGNKVIYRGYADSLALNTRTRTPKNYFLSLQYVWANSIQNEEYTIGLRDKLLNLSVKAPQVVYPGQTVSVEIGVTDVRGKPVENADVTAYAFTRKFTDARVPFIPYLGKTYPNRKAGTAFYTRGLEDWYRSVKLNWQRWSREMGLDSLEYFRFLHPQGLYWNKEVARDSITQLAPFITIKGDLQPIHLLYIDEKPVFFSQSQHLQRYSFRVQPGKHTLRLRIQDRIITLKDIEVPRGVKTILSIDGDTSNKLISIQKAPDTLTRQERALLTRYSILMDHHFGEYLSYVEQDGNLFMLPPSTHRTAADQYLVGPLTPHGAALVVEDQYVQPFEVEAGYSYHISQGLIKQKEVPLSRYIGKRLYKRAPVLNFSDLVLTGAEVDSLWADYLVNRSANEDLFVNSWADKKGNGSLRIEVPNDKEGKEVFVKSVILFRHGDTDFIKVMRGRARDLGYLAPGWYRLFLLLRDDRYVLMDSVQILKDGVNFYEISAAHPKEKDSISKKLSRIIQDRKLDSRYSAEGLDQIKESFNSGYIDAATFHSSVSGQVRDKKGVPIAGVSVRVKGTQVATQTDSRGFYRLNVPDHGTLVFSSVGFESIEKAIEGNQMDALLVEAISRLEEVVVVGYGTVRRSNLTGSVSSVTSGALSGRAPGVYIRGVSSLQGSTAPLIVIDGVPFDGMLEDLDPSLLAGMTVLKDEVAKTLYGARAAGGAVLITTKKPGINGVAGVDGLPVPANSLRRHFRDDAYWQPALRTDKAGKARFTTTFPDDITNWHTFAIAMTNGRRSGFAEGSIRSFKPISANLLAPLFAVEGDELTIIGKTLSYSTDSLRLNRSLTINQHVEKQGVIGVRNSFLDTVLVKVPDLDSMHFRLEIQKEDGYFDGEERSIPVFKTGVKETRGVFASLEGDTSFTVQLDPALGPVTLHAEASLLPVLLEESEKVRRYEYFCNEQLASKLKALLVQKRIDSLLKIDFKEEGAIRDIVSRLNNSKTGQLWGWWASNEPAAWISLHVVEALLEAEKEGYKTNLSKAGLVDYLVFRLEDYSYRDKLLVLNLLQRLGAKVEYKKYLDSLGAVMKKQPGRLSLYDQLRFIELKQKAGMSYSLDSLLSEAKHTLFGNLYWGEEGYRFFDNSIQNTVLMYRVLKAKGGQDTLLRKIRNYFLEKRKDGQWRNTYESSLILETLLPDLLAEGASSRRSVLHLEGSEEVKEFPFHKEVSAGQKISLRKEGVLPVYFTAFQQTWNAKPISVAGAFTVATTFEKGGDAVARLKAGAPLDLKVEVVVKGDADFVMIEVPIPAGCSYNGKPQPYTNNEVHREYLKNKVSIFCSSLRQGSYTFRVPLLPRYTGKYHLNPAKAEMMYFPVFYGREGLKQVAIY